MTEQPPETTEHDGRDHATPEQKSARALRANDLANALVTVRDHLPAAAKHIEDIINEHGIIDGEETIRMLANCLLALTNRIGYYARTIDTLTGDPNYFDKRHTEAVLQQQIDPVVRHLNTHPEDQP